MVWRGALLLAVAVCSGTADAGPFTKKSSQGEWTRSRVDRGWVLPKGWLSVGLAVEHKNSTSYRGSDGGLRAQPDGMLWQHSKLWLELHQGFSDRVTLYGRLPYVRSSLQPATGNQITTIAVGDAHAGIVMQSLGGAAWDTAVSADLKLPSGVEWPEGTGGPANTSSFLTGTGITNLGLYVHALARVPGVASAMARVGYVRKFPGVVGYVTATDGFGNGIINPGDEWVADTELRLSAASFASVAVVGTVRRLGTAVIGINGDGERLTTPVRHSAGTWVDAGVEVSVEPSAHWAVELGVAVDRYGGDSRPFAHLGLEEFSPQPGVQWSSRLVSRW
ncbi:MAG: hypothetical protein VX127_12825 [Myxococcota bacterium]|nr:hypothetical protein [Myxococcota bacterium]